MKIQKILALSSIVLATSAFAKQQPMLTVYTYDSFTAEWGAAPKLKPIFEKECGCTLKFMPFQDGITMFNRIRLEGKKTKADVMLGLDNFSMPKAEESGLFAENGLDTSKFVLPTKWTNKTFYPYDYGEFAFIYDKEKLKNPPKSLKELVKRDDLKVIYQDPRTSTVGNGLLMWVNGVYGDNAKSAWEQLAKHTVTVGKGWSETYGAFLKGESDLVLSYSTSPLYHIWNDKTDKYVAANFEEGHLAQIETAAILKTSQHKKLAEQFLAFLTSPQAQEIIVQHNIMKPVVEMKAGTEINSALKALPSYKVLDFAQPDVKTIKQWQNVWQTAVSK